jgi:uncharacterized phage protein (TIGR01671 family)
MREILFRGKRIDNKEWVEGAFVKKIDPLTGIPSYFIVGQGVTQGMLDPLCTWYIVDPATAGQYTGRTDRNGKKIFEGDIVKTWLEGGAHSGFSWPLGVVEFRESAFGLAHGKYKFTPFSSYAPRVLMEVVGNIHDNPELLKEGE